MPVSIGILSIPKGTILKTASELGCVFLHVRGGDGATAITCGSGRKCAPQVDATTLYMALGIDATTARKQPLRRDGPRGLAQYMHPASILYANERGMP